MPGRILKSTHSGVRPASTSGIMEAMRANITTPAATEQNSLKLARCSPAHAMRSAPTDGASTASRGMTENVTI